MRYQRTPKQQRNHKMGVRPGSHKMGVTPNLWFRAQKGEHGVGSSGGDGGESNSSSRAFSRRPTTSVSDDLLSIYRSGIGTVPIDPSTSPCGLCYRLRDLVDSASPLNDASTARGDEAASTLTLLPKQRGREQAGGCQLLRFAT